MSPRLRPDAVAGAFKDGVGPPIVAAVGPESYLREQVLAQVAEAVLGDAGSRDVIVLQAAATTSDVDQDTLARFFDETRTGSLFGSKKVVALRHAGPLLVRYRRAFLAWCKNPGRAAVAVVLADDLAPTVLAGVEKAGVLVRCGGRGERGEDPSRFVARQAAEREKRLGRGEADLLVDLLGSDLATLANAVEVLSIHAGEKSAIEREDVEALFLSAREGSVWAFGDRLVEGDVTGALIESERCFAEGIPERTGSHRVTRSEPAIAVRLVSSFVTALCRTLTASEQIDAGVSRREIRWLGRVPWSAQQSALKAASSRQRRSLEAMTVFADETDRGMKSGGPAGRVAVARLAAAVRRLP